MSATVHPKQPPRRPAKAAANATKNQKIAAAAPPEPDLRAAQKLVLALMAIPGKSGEESRVQKFIVEQLRKAGASAAAIRNDQAHKHTPLKGEVGNLIFQMPGTIKAPRRLLMAHTDTVPLCVGSKPVAISKSRRASRITVDRIPSWC